MSISVKKQNEKISTKFVRWVKNQPPSDKGKRLRIYYATQASTKPPTFVIFVNKAELFHFSYQRYLENQLRAAFGFEGTPIHFIIRERGEKNN